jgi:competence protein ComEC
LPALDALGIRRVDALILTHGHQDHAGGASELIRSGRVRKLFIPQTGGVNAPAESAGDDLLAQVIKDARQQGVAVTELAVSDELKLNQQDCLRVLSCGVDPAGGRTATDANENALHFQLKLSGFNLLLMSDSTPATEQALLSDPRIVNNEVLKVAHHGSQRTTQWDFLEKVRPQVAIISVGPNQYGHPSPETVERLSAVKANLLRTDRQGAVFLAVRSGRLEVRSMRKDSYGQVSRSF